MPVWTLGEDAALVLRKCCARGQVLSAPDYNCVARTTPETGKMDWLDPSVPIESRDGRRLDKLFPFEPPDGAIEYGNGFPCSIPLLMSPSSSDIVLLENGILRRNNYSFPPESYCTDQVQNNTEDSYMYIVCGFKKCCQCNQAVDWTENFTINCTEQTHGLQNWSPEVYDHQLRLINISEFSWKFFTPNAEMYRCDNNSYYRIMVDSKHSFYLQSNGSVFASEPFNKVFEYGDFCADRTVIRGEIHTAIVICLEHSEKLTFCNVLCVTVNLSICLCVLVLPSLVPKLYTTTMKLVMCHVVCDVFIYVIRTLAFFWGDLPMPVCKTYALTMQYFRLSGFFWINVMCIDMTLKFSGKMQAPERGRLRVCTRRFAGYSLHAWGCPAVIVAVTAAMDLIPGLPDHPLRPYIGDFSCSFHNLKTALLYYYIPVIMLVLINIGLFVATSIAIYRTKQEVLDILTMDRFQSDIQIANRQDQRSLVLYLKMFFLMGLTYVTEIIAWWDGSTFTSIIMDVNSMLLSIFVFLLFCCKPQVVRERLQEVKARWSSASASRGSGDETRRRSGDRLEAVRERLLALQERWRPLKAAPPTRQVALRAAQYPLERHSAKASHSVQFYQSTR